MNALDKILAQWNWAKREQEAMAKKVEACKTQVESILVKSNLMELQTANYKVSKRMQTRETCSKKDLPADIWSQYAKSSQFSVLTFTALTGKAAKAKATPKAKGAAKAT